MALQNLVYTVYRTRHVALAPTRTPNQTCVRGIVVVLGAGWDEAVSSHHCPASCASALRGDLQRQLDRAGCRAQVFRCGEPNPDKSGLQRFHRPNTGANAEFVTSSALGRRSLRGYIPTSLFLAYR